ncbi:MAG: adenine nucleotide alpha hydrolase [Chitinophagaceae bacterium]|nr:adenine nucleotide alpha hydrolase [Chitinophagaceae bacterium]MCW5904413.1 adenine nucleotide alpha hydrolase [Chitinophagaceae bacterium]
MNLKKKAVFNWSGGKDAGLALQQILISNEFDIVSLLTTIEEPTTLSSVHAIPVEILLQQAKSMNMPLYTISVAKDLSNYHQKMTEAVTYFKQQGVTHFIFGDLAASDIKTYRENFFHSLHIEVVEPLLHKTSEEVIQDFLASGMRAKIIVVNAAKLNKEFVGKELNKQTIESFPTDIDVCGEYGEYHTLVFAGNLFKEVIAFSIIDVQKIAYNIQLDNNENTIVEYWQALITT